MILFDDSSRISLRPLTFFRPISEIRIGILTIAEKWKNLLKQDVSYLTEPYLQEKFPIKATVDNLMINSSIIPDSDLVKQILELQTDTSLIQGDFLIAMRLTSSSLQRFAENASSDMTNIEYDGNIQRIVYPWDILKHHKSELISDFQLITKDRQSAPLGSSNYVLGDQLFIEEGAQIDCATFDTRSGPVYIGKHARVMPGTHTEGCVAIGEHATAKMGSLLYAGTSLGPWCKVGGEISNSIMFAYSAKAHDGYMGDSVISEWCNLGAGTTISNLKNNYKTVKQWSYAKDRFVDTKLQFCGLIMGDHCKTGISTMFNSGTTTGVCCNIFGSGYQRNFIPSFSWGGNSGYSKNKYAEVIEAAQVAYSRRALQLSEVEEKLFKEVFEITYSNNYL